MTIKLFLVLTGLDPIALLKYTGDIGINLYHRFHRLALVLFSSPSFAAAVLFHDAEPSSIHLSITQDFVVDRAVDT